MTINGGIVIKKNLTGYINSDANINGNINNTETLSGELNQDSQINGIINQASSIYVKEIVFDDFVNFPNIGDSQTLYISTDSTKRGVYFFNESISSYEVIAIQDKNYVHEQLSASKQWYIKHNLNKFPSVTIVDSGNNTVTGEISYIDANNILLSFSAEFTGKAYCN